MEQAKKIGTDVLVVVVGVLLALKVQEWMNKSKLTPPSVATDK